MFHQKPFSRYGDTFHIYNICDKYEDFFHYECP